MKIKIYILFLALALAVAPQAWAHDKPEHQIKAAFVYNFLKFAEWPEDKVTDSNDTITIGIIGKEHFGEAFEPIKEKKVKVKDKKIIIKKIPSITTYKNTYKRNEYKDKYKADYSDALKKCHLLFISSSEKEHLKEIIKFLKGASVLTVSETPGFIEQGGIINFVMEKKKVRFEINNTAAKQAELKIRSQLLRLAKKVIDEKTPKDAEK